MSFLDNYEDVATRIKRLHATHPTNRVETSIVDFNADKGWILVECRIFKEYEDEKPSAIDFAFGRVESYNAQMKRFFVEDTTTSAIGRAAGLLLGTDKRPTLENMKQVETLPSSFVNKVETDPWATVTVTKTVSEIPSYKTAAEAENAGVPSFGSSADLLGSAIAEISAQLGGELIPEAPKCDHGHRIWRESKPDAFKKWAGYFCTERAKANQCQPFWYVVGASGKWSPQL